MSLSVSHYIDCSEDEFREFCKDKDLGYINSFHNLMVQIYNQVQRIKDDVVAEAKNKGEDHEDYDNYKTSLESLYAKLLKIEHKVFILKEIQKSRMI